MKKEVIVSINSTRNMFISKLSFYVNAYLPLKKICMFPTKMGYNSANANEQISVRKPIVWVPMFPVRFACLVRFFDRFLFIRVSNYWKSEVSNFCMPILEFFSHFFKMADFLQLTIREIFETRMNQQNWAT